MIIKTSHCNYMLESAHRYAKDSYRVFKVHWLICFSCSCCRKCEKPGKHHDCAHGFKYGTNDTEQIKAWLDVCPWLNIGIATGDGLWVLDSDPRHDGDKTLSSLQAKHGALPRTACVKTGGGGYHYYFRATPGVVVRSRSSVAPGIDTRAHNDGYVIATPSLHESGHLYECVVPLESGLAEAPDWLLAIVAEPSPKPSKGFMLTMGSAEPDLASHPGASEGSRNAEFCRMLGIHLSRGDSPATLDEALAYAWASRCSPALPKPSVRIALRWAESKREHERDS